MNKALCGTTRLINKCFFIKQSSQTPIDLGSVPNDAWFPSRAPYARHKTTSPAHYVVHYHDQYEAVWDAAVWLEMRAYKTVPEKKTFSYKPHRTFIHTIKKESVPNVVLPFRRKNKDDIVHVFPSPVQQTRADYLHEPCRVQCDLIVASRWQRPK